MALRILSYNILAGGEGRLPLISNVIQKQQPDVVALLEARSLSNAEALAQQLGMSLTIGEANNINQDHVVWLIQHSGLITSLLLHLLLHTCKHAILLQDQRPFRLLTISRYGPSSDEEVAPVQHQEVIQPLNSS